MDLPKIEVIGLEPTQALLQHLHRQARISPMRTHLSHQKDLVAQALQPLAQPVFRFAAVVLPATVKKRNTAIDRTMNDFDGCTFILGLAKMMPTHTECQKFSHRFCQNL